MWSASKWRTSQYHSTEDTVESNIAMRVIPEPPHVRACNAHLIHRCIICDKVLAFLALKLIASGVYSTDSERSGPLACTSYYSLMPRDESEKSQNFS
jgi:hypothetical protein